MNEEAAAIGGILLFIGLALLGIASPVVDAAVNPVTNPNITNESNAVQGMYNIYALLIPFGSILCFFFGTAIIFKGVKS